MIHSPYPEFDCNINYHVNNIISTGKYKIIQIKAPMSHKKQRTATANEARRGLARNAPPKIKKSRRITRRLLISQNNNYLLALSQTSFLTKAVRLRPSSVLPLKA